MQGADATSADYYIRAYQAGKLGTPENPNRGSTSYDTFWKVYGGYRTPADYRNTMVYAAAVAGKQVSREDRKL